MMVGQSNIENKMKLMLVEHRLTDVEETIRYLDKIMDGLDDFFLKLMSGNKDKGIHRDEDVGAVR